MLATVFLVITSCGPTDKEKEAEKRGRDEGYVIGKADGFEQGLEEGLQQGKKIGYTEGTKSFVGGTWIPALGLGVCMGIFITSVWGVMKTIGPSLTQASTEWTLNKFAGKITTWHLNASLRKIARAERNAETEQKRAELETVQERLEENRRRHEERNAAVRADKRATAEREAIQNYQRPHDVPAKTLKDEVPLDPRLEKIPERTIKDIPTPADLSSPISIDEPTVSPWDFESLPIDQEDYLKAYGFYQPPTSDINLGSLHPWESAVSESETPCSYWDSVASESSQDSTAPTQLEAVMRRLNSHQKPKT